MPNRPVKSLGRVIRLRYTRNMRFLESISIRGWFLAMVLAGFCAPSLAATLLVVEQPDCPYCERFNREIAEAYPKTDEGKRAPLVRVQLGDDWPERYAFVNPAAVTPTFILVGDDGEEVDRIVGYPGDEHFWFLLNELLDKLP